GWLATNPGIDIALEEQLSHEVASAVAQGHAVHFVSDVLATETYPRQWRAQIMRDRREHCDARGQKLLKLRLHRIEGGHDAGKLPRPRLGNRRGSRVHSKKADRLRKPSNWTYQLTRGNR